MTEQTSNDSQVESLKSSEQISEESAKNEDVDSKQKEDKFPREYVETLRRENAKTRTENKQLRDDLQKITIRSELKTAALSAGIRDLDALKMFDTSKLSISADGDVVGVDGLLAEMREKKPYLFERKSEKSVDETDTKTETKKQTSSASKVPESAAAKPKSAMELSKEEYDSMKRNGFKELSKIS